MPKPSPPSSPPATLCHCPHRSPPSLFCHCPHLAALGSGLCQVMVVTGGEGGEGGGGWGTHLKPFNAFSSNQVGTMVETRTRAAR